MPDVQTLVTFIVFSIEALIHFNIGKNSLQKRGESFKIQLPSVNELVKILVTVAIFSQLCTYFTHVSFRMT